jgi:hypothetical protein
VIRLKQIHKDERAAVIFGGPSLVANRFDFARLRDRGFVTFLETKALTPYVLESGFVPDYFLMAFPEKAKDNALQHFVYRSLLAGYRIDSMLKPAYRNIPVDLRASFDRYFEPWRPERGPHKRYRWKPDVYLQGSPYDLLARVPESRIIVNRKLLDQYFPQFAYRDRAFYFDQSVEESAFDLAQYFDPVERDGMLTLRPNAFLNSAAIALYPLLRYMGFREVYFLGMDMSMLGSLEFAAPYTFRSMLHFWWFFRRTMRVFNADYRPNGWWFTRPQSEFDDLRKLWAGAPIDFTRVYEPWRYATPIDGIRTIATDDFLKV